MLSAYWPDPQTEGHERKNPIARTLDRFNRWFDGQAEAYKSVIAWALDHRFAMVADRGGILRRRHRAAGDVGRRRLRAAERPERGERTARDAARIESRVHDGCKTEEVARIARAHPEVVYAYTSIGGAIPFRAPGVDQALHLRPPDPEGQAPQEPEEFGEDLPAGAGGGRRRRGLGVHQRLWRRAQADPTRSCGAPIRCSSRISPSGRRNWYGRCRARWTSGSRHAARSRNSRSSSIAGSPDRSGSRRLRWRSSLRLAFAGVKAGDWVDPDGETARRHVRLAADARANTRRPRAAAAPIRRRTIGTLTRCRSARSPR